MAEDESKTTVEKLQDGIIEIKKQTEKLAENKEELAAEVEEKKEQLEEETKKTKAEQDWEKIQKLTSDIEKANNGLKQLKEALEGLAAVLKELEPTLEQLVKLGDVLAKTVLALLKETLDFLTEVIGAVTDLIKSIGVFLKETLLFFLQLIFDIRIAGSITIQPLAEQSVEMLASVKERDVYMLAERGIHTLDDLAQADLLELERCGVDIGHVSSLQKDAKVAVRPFTDEFLYLIEEFDMGLMEVAKRAEAEFMQPKARVRAIREDVLSRAPVLKPGVLERLRVTDIIDIEVPKGFSQDCPPAKALTLGSLGLKIA